MAGELVLVTGGSGHLGFRVIVTALESGYRVRAPVRTNSKVADIKAAPSVQKYLDRLDLILIPDILEDGAYDEAVKGVTYIIHSASPLAVETTEYERDIINPAVKGTVGILTSAAKVDTVKRVVITLSAASIIPFMEMIMVETDIVFTDKSTFPRPEGPFQNNFQAYCASKALAWHASNDFLAIHKPAFDIISIFPTFFVGKNELIISPTDILTGTNSYAIGPVFGNKSAIPLPGTTVHINDVAKIEVFSLSAKIEGNQGFLLTSQGQEGTTWEDSIQIVKKNFPEAVKKGLFKLDGTQVTKKVKIDSSRTEEIFGFKFASYEEQIKSVIGHYMELTSEV